MEFSQQEIIDLILCFKTFGYHYEEVLKDEQVILKFKEFEGYEVDEEGICRLTQKGELFLHQHIEDMTKELWNLVKLHQKSCPFDIAKRFFCDKYCEDERDAEDILKYLIRNAETYSLETSRTYVAKKGNVIIMDKKK